MLRIPLYKLYYVDNLLDNTLFSGDFIENFRREYSIDERQEIMNALNWAVKNPDFDYYSLLPGLNFNNKQIYDYLMRLRLIMRANEL